MKTGLFIAAALALMTRSLPAPTRSAPGNNAGPSSAFSAMPVCSAKISPGSATSPTRRVPACECRKFVQRSSVRSAAAMARPTQTTASGRRRRFPRRITGSASPTRRDGKRVTRANCLRHTWPLHPARHDGASRPRDRIDAAGQTLHEPRARVSMARGYS